MKHPIGAWPSLNAPFSEETLPHKPATSAKNPSL